MDATTLKAAVGSTSPETAPADSRAQGDDESSRGALDALDALATARLCADLLDSQKLGDISIFDVRDTLQISDYFVLASGSNQRQIKSACDFVRKELKERGIERFGAEGASGAKWVLLDYDAVVVHVFLDEQRRFYDLELLWGDSPRVDWSPPAPAVSPAAPGTPAESPDSPPSDE